MVVVFLVDLVVTVIMTVCSGTSKRCCAPITQGGGSGWGVETNHAARGGIIGRVVHNYIGGHKQSI